MEDNAVSLKAENSSNMNQLSWSQSFIRKQVVQSLMKLKGCCIEVSDAHGDYMVGEQSSNMKVQLKVHHSDFYHHVALHGSIGVAESYMLGQWEVDDLTKLIQIFVINRDLLDSMEGGFASVKNNLLKVWNLFKRNSLKGSRNNIAAHYDLGNDFFKLFLDQNLMYSSAIYEDASDSLESASLRKLQTICEKLQLSESDHLLEIGTGWGGLAVYAAKNYGCKVTTTTLSKEQFDHAKNRIETEGLQDKITLLQSDYRNLKGRFSRVVSIEMIEAVGHQYLDTYFEKINQLLDSDGLALIQAITIEDYRYKQALKSVDFIKRYIFPGSFIPSVSAIVSSCANSSTMRLINLEDFGESYAYTLRDWRLRFFEEIDQVREQGYSEEFIKMWEFYLCYCEGGFLEKAISDVHLLFAKPKNKRNQWLAHN